MNEQARQIVQSQRAILGVMELALLFLNAVRFAALVDPRINTFLDAEMRRLSKGATR